MYSFCVLELENAVILEFGRTSAKYNAADPHPHLVISLVGWWHHLTLSEDHTRDLEYSYRPSALP